MIYFKCEKYLTNKRAWTELISVCTLTVQIYSFNGEKDV